MEQTGKRLRFFIETNEAPVKKVGLNRSSWLELSVPPSTAGAFYL